jgi:hypothetical protein
MKVLRPKLYFDSTCPLCKNETSCHDETIEHVFYDCPSFETSRKAFLASITGIVSLDIPGLSKVHISHCMKEIFIQPRHEDEVHLKPIPFDIIFRQMKIQLLKCVSDVLERA